MTINIKKHLGSKITYDPELLEQLMEKKFNVKVFDKEISYRTVNYWEAKGYLLLERERDESDWRKLSFVDYIWIRMLDELRQMGVSIEGVVKVLFRELGIKDEVLEELSFEQYDKMKGLPFEKLLTKIDKNLVAVKFCLLLVNIVSYRNKLSIRVFKNGEYSEFYSNQYFHEIVIKDLQRQEKRQREINNYESFISISISNLISDYIGIKELDNIAELNLLSEDETEILNHIRNKNLKEITVKLADGTPSHIELTEIDYNADITKRIYEDMLGADYVECNYVTNTKKQVTFTRITKIKLQ